MASCSLFTVHHISYQTNQNDEQQATKKNSAFLAMNKSTWHSVNEFFISDSIDGIVWWWDCCAGHQFREFQSLELNEENERIGTTDRSAITYSIETNKQ